MGHKDEDELSNGNSENELQSEDSDQEVHNENNKRPLKTNKSEKSKHKKKLKQPTVEELNELNETQTLFNNNLFRLQITELLQAIKIKNKHKERFSAWLKNFQLLLNTLPEEDSIDIAQFSKKDSKRSSRFQRIFTDIESYRKSNLRCDQDIPVTFIKSNCFETFGLYKLDSLPGPTAEINLQMIIPRKCFHLKDYLNNRYSIKKFFYLVYFAEWLKSQNICSSIKFAYYYENFLMPHLIVSPNDSEKVVINIFFIPEHNYFKGTRFLPDVNNVKVPIFGDLSLAKIENLGETSTALYNASLAFDVTLADNNAFIEQVLSNIPNIQEGLKLIIVWMNQRKLNEGLGSFSNDITLYIIVYLTHKKKINKHMSSYQVFRSFLNFMITMNFSDTPISICDNISDDVLQKFKTAFDVVIIDSTGCYNVASFLSMNVYLKVKYECQLAFSILDQDSLNSFSSLFLTKVPFYLQYDAIIDIKIDNNFDSLLKTAETSEVVKFAGNHTLLIVKILQGYLMKGLNKRTINIVPYVPTKTEWNHGVSCEITNHRVMFGLQLDPDNAFDILEFGPELNDPREKDFKEFWGRLSSNRRFRDGSAKVVVHFDTNTIKERRGIVKTIVDFIMVEKLKLNYKFYYNEFEELLVNKKINTWYPSGSNEDTTAKIISCSDELGQKIRNLDIQLGIMGIGNISDVYCYTNVFPPVPTSYRSGKVTTTTKDQNIILKGKKIYAAPKYVEPVTCVIHLEHSSKWPTDLEAIRAMKVMFLIRVSKMLMKEHNIISSVKPPFIDILYQGIVFRYTLYLSKEVGLLKKQLKPNGAVTYKDNEESRELEKNFNVVPKVIGALKGIQAQFPSYGASTCLVKRWIRSQLIDDYLLPDMVINLLNAHQFLNQSSFNATVTPQVAFLRLLKYISDVAWDLEPIVVNFNDELTKNEISHVDSQLRSNRQGFPPLFILTPFDKETSIFTKTAPSKEVLNALKALAEKSLCVIEKIILEDSLCNIKDLFLPNKNGFNLILNLRSMVNPRRHEQIVNSDEDGQMCFSKPSGEETHLPVVDFNPVESYLKSLRDMYGEFCEFFHDKYGGNYIGVLWNPKELQPKDIKLSYVFGRKVVNSQLVLDTEEIILGFRKLGVNILKSIDVNSQ